MNPFDQFDTQPTEQAGSGAAAPNPFDQFDKAPSRSFSDRVRDDYADRMKKGEKIAEEYVSGNQSYPETLAQFGGQGAAFGSDVVLQGLKSLGNSVSSITPDFIKEPLKKGAAHGVDYIGDTALGRKATQGANYAIQKYGDFAEKFPRAARNVEAATNIGLSLAPAVRVGGKSAASTAQSLAKEGVGSGAQLAKEGLKKVASPIVPNIPEGAAEVVQLAQKYNIPVSLPQISDSRALSNIQKISQELPFSGSASFRDKQLASWQKQLLKTAGVDAERFSPSVMQEAFKKVGGEFDSLTKGKNFNIADDFVDNLAKTQDEVLSAYGNDAANAFGREALKVFNDFSAEDLISGEKLAFHRARINSLARKATGANKEALQDLENIIIDGITSRDPQAMSALSTAKQKYKNLIAIEPLAQKAKKGYINPSLLNNRVSKIYKRAYTTGNAGEIGDLARIGHELLGELGGSDTTQKLLYTAGATGGAIANLPLTSAAIGANRAMQSGVLRNQGIVKLAAEKAQKQRLKQIMKMKPSEARKALEELKE